MKIETALYLIPVSISDGPVADVIPQANIDIIRQIHYFIVENVRTARRFLKKVDKDIDISAITFFELNGHTDPMAVSSYLDPLREGNPVGIMSEAGCPGIADPGALAVRQAQHKSLRVIPLVGPSSILLALMASGLNGQNFAFHGYLPVENTEREQKLRELENQSSRNGVTQIFIETPYRNARMAESLFKTLKPDTLLCIAENITDPFNERIVTKTIREWRVSKFETGKVPAIFLFYCLNPKKEPKI